jgi:L-propargylglycine--L-glutamate ligase
MGRMNKWNSFCHDGGAIVMLEISAYAMDYSEGILREIPYVKYFVERGLTHLTCLRDPANRLALIGAQRPHPDILSYYLRDICGMSETECCSALSRIIFIQPPSSGQSPVYDSLLGDPKSLGALKEAVADAGEARLHVFAANTWCEELGRRIGVRPSERPDSMARYWGSKAGGKEAFRLAGVPSPPGEGNPYRSLEDVTDAALRLAGGARRPRHVIVKLNDASWGDGIGNVVINSTKLMETGALSQAVESILQSWHDFVLEIPHHGAIVEEFLSGVTSSPSGQGLIEEDGSVKAISSHEQIVSTGQYIGCSFPAEERFIDRINLAIERVGRVLSLKGLRGSFGIDFLGLDNGDLYAAEINVRKVAPTHVTASVETATGLSLGIDGRTAGRRVRYVHRRLYAPRLRHLSSTTATDALRAHGLLYDKQAGRGVLLHILGALQPCGYVEVTAIDHDQEQAAELSYLAEAALFAAASTGSRSS